MRVSSFTTFALTLLHIPFATARKITFPSTHGLQYAFASSSNLDDVNIVSGSAFSGLTTFANLPYTNCFVNDEHVESYDVVFMGAPFDTVCGFVFSLLFFQVRPCDTW